MNRVSTRHRLSQAPKALLDCWECVETRFIASPFSTDTNMMVDNSPIIPTTNTGVFFAGDAMNRVSTPDGYQHDGYQHDEYQHGGY